MRVLIACLILAAISERGKQILFDENYVVYLFPSHCYCRSFLLLLSICFGIAFLSATVLFFFGNDDENSFVGSKHRQALLGFLDRTQHSARLDTVSALVFTLQWSRLHFALEQSPLSSPIWPPPQQSGRRAGRLTHAILPTR